MGYIVTHNTSDNTVYIYTTIDGGANWVGSGRLEFQETTTFIPGKTAFSIPCCGGDQTTSSLVNNFAMSLSNGFWRSNIACNL